VYHAAVIHLRVPGTLRYRDIAVRVIQSACKLVGAADMDTGPFRVNSEWDNQVVSAFGEAFNNAAIHSYRNGKPGDVEVEVDVGPTHITIRLIDFGTSFNPDAVPNPDLDALPESGLGLFIIRSFMDEVTYEAGSPNVLSMTKRLTSQSRAKSTQRDLSHGKGGGSSHQ
jgi:serine/threonine-protein kinase RsbW